MASSLTLSPALLIPDLLAAAPQARAVLDRYGLRGCGGPLGPHESLDFFARAHEVPVERLLTELRAAVARPAADPGDAPAPGRWSADAIYRPFFLAGIAVVLTLGAVWGAYLLVRIASAGKFTAVGLHEVNAHGHAQIFGWVGLFVMGFAYQAFPRFKHTSLRFPGLAWLSFGLMLAGVVARSLLEPLADGNGPLAWAAVAASAVEVVAIGLFVFGIAATWRASGKGLAAYDGYIAAALFWFLAQAVYETVYAAATFRAELLYWGRGCCYSVASESLLTPGVSTRGGSLWRGAGAGRFCWACSWPGCRAASRTRWRATWSSARSWSKAKARASPG